MLFNRKMANLIMLRKAALKKLQQVNQSVIGSQEDGILSGIWKRVIKMFKFIFFLYFLLSI